MKTIQLTEDELMSAETVITSEVLRLEAIAVFGQMAADGTRINNLDESQKFVLQTLKSVLQKMMAK